MNMVNRSGMLVRWMHRFFEGRERMHEWKVMNRSRLGLECDVRKWTSEIDKTVKSMRLSKWKTEKERKKVLEWYREKEAPMYARAQCMDVNARNYRWSESRSKVRQMCDMGEDETVELVVLECVKYDHDRMEMMRMILT